jgi:hypothetical protein
MNPQAITLLSKPGEIRDYVYGLWSDGPVRRNHRDGGMVHEIVERFAQMPRIFFRSSSPELEWTHFSPLWGAIMLADYDNPAIRDLRYLHEIYHSATMPYARGMNLATMAARNDQNEREASTFSEIAIYLEIPELRDLSFPHEIFGDRLLFEGGDRTRPNMRLRERWRTQRETVFQEMLYARLGVVMAEEHEVDATDPQVMWLRRYPEQGSIWRETWRERHQLVDDAMVSLRERCETDPVGAGERHLDWLLTDEISDGTMIPFRREAEAFRRTFDALIASYDAAMQARGEQSVKNTTTA